MTDKSSPWQWRQPCENGQCVQVASDGDGHVLMRDSGDPDGPRLTFSAESWAEFIAGAKDGEFDTA
jgi:hypothetical protein